MISKFFYFVHPVIPVCNKLILLLEIVLSSRVLHHVATNCCSACAMPHCGDTTVLD